MIEDVKVKNRDKYICLVIGVYTSTETCKAPVTPDRAIFVIVRLLAIFSDKDYSPEFSTTVQYIPRNMHTVFALLCFVVVIHWLIFPYPSGLLHWHCGNLTIAPVPTKQPWCIWINTSCEFIMNDCITTTKQSTTRPCAYFLGYTVDCDCFWGGCTTAGTTHRKIVLNWKISVARRVADNCTTCRCGLRWIAR